jgi:ferredoxin-NADP reductase
MTAVLTGYSSSSVLALATTLHLALASLRNHRSAGSSSVSSLAVVSLALAGLPWIFPSVLGLALGVGVHLVWFLVCETFAPAPAAPTPAPLTPTERPTRASAPAARAQAPKGFVQVPVLSVFDETSAIKTVRVARPEGFGFAAGQFVTVRIRVDGREYARCYSVSSAPCVSGYLELSIRRQGLVSNALHATVRPGAPVFIKAPAGAFRYPEGDDRPLVLLAGGIGITPLVSMLRHALVTEPTRPVTLLYCARAETEFAFRDELTTAARRHPQFRLFLAVSGGSSEPSHYPGRIDEALLRTTVPDVAHSIALICGPGDMIASMKSLLTGLGVPQGQIRHEVFQPAVAASAGLRPDHEAAGGEEGQPAAAPPRSRRASDHQMVCTRSGKAVPVRAGQTLLEAAEDGGVAIDSLCRAGVCGTCRVQVSAGEVDCESTTLDEEDQSRGFVLACVSTAKSDCTVIL